MLGTPEEYSGMLGLALGCDSKKSSCMHGSFDVLMTGGVKLEGQEYWGAYYKSRQSAVTAYDASLQEYANQHQGNCICWRIAPVMREMELIPTCDAALYVKENEPGAEGSEHVVGPQTVFYVYSRLRISNKKEVTNG